MIESKLVVVAKPEIIKAVAAELQIEDISPEEFEQVLRANEMDNKAHDNTAGND